MLKLVLLFLSICVCAKSYKIGGKILITHKDIDAVYARLIADRNADALVKYMSFDSVAEQMIFVRSVVFILKSLGFVPENYKVDGVGYEADNLIFSQYCAKVRESVDVSDDEIVARKDAYSQMRTKKRCFVREVFLSGHSAENFSLLEKLSRDLDSTSAELFTSYVAKYSTRKSKDHGGIVGLVNVEYFRNNKNVYAYFLAAKKGSCFIVDEADGYSLIYVEYVEEFSMPAHGEIRNEITSEKIIANLYALREFMPVDVHEI